MVGEPPRSFSELDFANNDRCSLCRGKVWSAVQCYGTISKWQVVDVQMSFGQEIAVRKFGCSNKGIAFGSMLLCLCGLFEEGDRLY